MIITARMIRRVTAKAVQVIIWDATPRPVAKNGRHRVLWIPRYMIRGEQPNLGDEDVQLEVSYDLVRLEQWAWLEEKIRREFIEEWG